MPIQLRYDKRTQISAALVTVALAVLLPFLIHLIGGPTAGARWLPMFYAPLLAALLFHPAVALSAAFVAPFLNHVVTGGPALPMVGILTLELIIFVIAVQLLNRRRPGLVVVPAAAFALAKGSSWVTLSLAPTILPISATQYFLTSLIAAWPGLLTLTALYLLALGATRRGR